MFSGCELINGCPIKVINSPADVVVALREELARPILKDVTYRAEWEEHQRELAAEKEKSEAKEQLEFNRIDWGDFVIVNTIEFLPSEKSKLALRILFLPCCLHYFYLFKISPPCVHLMRSVLESPAFARRERRTSR